MAFDFGKWLPYLISGGASVAGAVIGSRAAGKAGEQSAAAAELASETQLQMSREQIANLRDIYSLDLGMNWPRHRVSTESLGNLARGMGSKLPPSTFETSEAPPELPGFGADGVPGGAPPGGAPPESDPLNPNAQAPINTPPPGTGPAGTGSRTLSGMATGASLGSVVPGVGTAIGAGVGGLAGWLSGVFGGDQRIADHIVPSQNDLTSRIGEVGGELSRRINDGTATEQDWQNAIQIVENMRSQFYGFADETAGGDASGARGSIDAWVNPMLDAWGKRALNWSDDWSTWKFDPEKVWSPSPSQTPSRQFGGPVRSLASMASMGKPGGRPYQVGEAGPEMFVPNDGGQPSMVGMGGPEITSFPEDGYIIPNHDLGQPGSMGGRNPRGRTYNLSSLGGGAYGIPSRKAGGRVRGPKRLTPENENLLRGWGWSRDRRSGKWTHAETGNVGTVSDGSTLVDNQNNASFNFDHYQANPDSYTGGVAVHDAAGEVIPVTPPDDPPPAVPPPDDVPDDPPPAAPAPPPAGRAPASGPALSPNNARELESWGWTLRPDGTWYHAETGNVGTVRDGSTLVDNQNNASFNFDHYRANPDSYTGGVAVHDAAGEVIAPAPPPAPNSDNSRSPSGPIAEREFIDPDPNRGNYAPPSSATHPAPDPFSWQARGDMPGPSPGMIQELNSWGWHEQGDGTWRHKDGDTAHFVNDTTMVSLTGNKTFHVDRYLAGRDDHTEEGISDLHRQFDPSEYGYMPLNEQFEFDPSEAGYMPFNEQFEFDTEDLLKDPGYQWRLNEGSKAVERKGASRGMLQSGRTLKSLSSWAQGLASQEYGAAYGRARGEHQMGYGQSADAYNRELGEFGMRRGQSLGAYDQALQRWGMKYGMYGDEYNRASGEYERERDEWRWDDQRRYGRTRDLAGI